MVVVRCTIFMASIESRINRERRNDDSAVAMELFWLSHTQLGRGGFQR
jgi:hypothetical protein